MVEALFFQVRWIRFQREQKVVSVKRDVVFTSALLLKLTKIDFVKVCMFYVYLSWHRQKDVFSKNII